MSNKWANSSAPKAVAANEDDMVARRRAALADIQREEAEEAENELNVANKAH